MTPETGSTSARPDRENWLQRLIDEERGEVCTTPGCTTCGGSTGEVMFAHWIARNTRGQSAERLDDLVEALDAFRLNRRNAILLEQFLDYLAPGYPHRYPRILDSDLRSNPRLIAARMALKRCIQERDERRCAAYKRWERMQPPEWHEEQAKATAKWAEQAKQHLLRNDPRWVAAYRANKKATAAAKHAARLLAKAEREILNPR